MPSFQASVFFPHPLLYVLQLWSIISKVLKEIHPYITSCANDTTATWKINKTLDVFFIARKTPKFTFIFKFKQNIWKQLGNAVLTPFLFKLCMILFTKSLFNWHGFNFGCLITRIFPKHKWLFLRRSPSKFGCAAFPLLFTYSFISSFTFFLYFMISAFLLSSCSKRFLQLLTEILLQSCNS